MHQAIVSWFGRNARDLPWRSADCSPWGVLVSEVMLQQTPVVRVLPVWKDWMSRWPDPGSLAAAASGDAVRAWGRLGYPRRALRLHAAAAAITAEYDGEVPGSYDRLLTLPGVGSYTAAAVAAFAFGHRETVVDTNIRRVQARLSSGQALPAPALTAAEMRLATRLLPEEPVLSVKWNAAVMELGALICTARSPRCTECPVRAECSWLAAGEPEPTYTPRGQAWAGTDRQVRGAMMAALRAAESGLQRELLFAAAPSLVTQVHGTGTESEPDSDALSPVGAQLHRLYALKAEEDQLERAIEGLLRDGLAQALDGGRIALPL
ncbi:A/G-specific adenine glycosylase [Arthrobacter sp. A5]|uniref:A/G-specific adenine glycosylase n=1 Tax=Arthrobacter sp. A5 TaxID=576926 RepID=UPI003DA87DA8